MATASAIIPAAPPTTLSTDDVFRDGTFQPNDWRILGDGEDLTDGLQAVVSLKRALSLIAGGEAGNRPLAAIIAPGDRTDELIPHLHRFSMIAVDFPKYSDGRGFSHATRLVRAGFCGELRAIGNVLVDQIDFMRRVGITAFEVRHAVTRRYLEAGREPAPGLYYQPAARAEAPAGTRPWLRRRS